MADRGRRALPREHGLAAARLARRPAAAERRRRAGELRSLQHDQPVRPRRAGRLAARRDGGGGHAGDRCRACRRPMSSCPSSPPPKTWRRRPGRWCCGSTASAIRISVILASMYRQLAHAPGFPAPGRSRAGAGRSRRLARPCDRRQPEGRPRTGEGPGAGDRRATAATWPAQVEASVSAFVDHAIGKMVTICRAIRQARGSRAAFESRPVIAHERRAGIHACGGVGEGDGGAALEDHVAADAQRYWMMCRAPGSCGRR